MIGLTNTVSKVATREEWLVKVADKLSKEFQSLGYTVPKIRIAMGFTSKGRRSNRIGECWCSSMSDDGVFEIFIVPSIDEEERLADILAHEMIHAIVGLKAKHGKEFKKCALAIGLEGKMTATVAGPAFKKMIAPILEKVGPVPHKKLKSDISSLGPKQTTRLIKCECPDCGYVVRTTAKWLEIGSPICPIDNRSMLVKEK